ncbi:NAD(P)-binding domain-containing protein [Actinocrispum sp. NPDC049592]|uniref:NADPH-dependent F420 reductase n=1 Tax=Actinocrispum sp. NPDC049592 TaxID=3154835 RepID=UPI0034412A17
MNNTITVVGAGNMGRAIARRYAVGGADVLLVDMDADRAADVAAQMTDDALGRVTARPLGEALDSDIVVFATWFPQTLELLSTHAGPLSDSVVVDISNPLNDTFDDLTTAWGSSAAEELAVKAPGVRLVKAFNTVFAPVLIDGAIDGVPLDVFVASDHEDAKRAVVASLEGTGLRAIDAGGLSAARTLERLTLLQIGIQNRLGLEFRTAVKVLPHVYTTEAESA